MELLVLYLVLTFCWFSVGGIDLLKALYDTENYSSVLKKVILQTPQPLRVLHLWGCFGVLVPFVFSLIVVKKLGAL